MDIEFINKVEVLETGELLLGLESQGKPTYQFVYREAAGVYWDESRNGFKSTEMKEWTCYEWFKHIVKIVRSGLGIELRLGANVDWVKIPENNRKEIEQEYANIQIN